MNGKAPAGVYACACGGNHALGTDCPNFPPPGRGLPGPADGWTRQHEVTLECLALSQDRQAAAALAALGEINRLRQLLADAAQVTR